MGAVADLQQFGLVQRVCEHSHCPAAIATDSTKSLLVELKKDHVAPETMKALEKAQHQMLRHFFRPPSVAQWLKAKRSRLLRPCNPSLKQFPRVLRAF